MTRSKMSPAELHSGDAEMSCIGAMYVSERAAEQIAAALKPEMFHFPKHRKCFEVLSAIVRERKPIDPVTVKEKVIALGGMDEVDDEFLTEVAIFMPSAANAEFYTDIVKDHWRLRELKRRADDLSKGIAQGALMASDAWGVASELGRGLEIGARDLFNPSEFDLNAPQEAWLPSGVKCLDAKGNGGIFPRGHMTMIGALTGGGKTVFMAQVSSHLLMQGYRVLYCTLEMSGMEIKRLMVKTLCGWDKTPSTMAQLGKWDAANMMINNSALTFWDPSERDSSEKTVEKLVESAGKLHHGRAIDAIVIDYGQLFSTSKKIENRTRELDTVAHELFGLAKRTKAAVIVGAQLIAAKGEDPRIADCSMFLKDSAQALFLAITKPEDEPETPVWQAAIRVAKTRNGNYGAMQMNFRRQFARFEDPNSPPAQIELDPFAE